MKLHRRRAERDAENDEFSREKYANPIGPDSRGPSSQPLAKRFTEMSIFLFHADALILEAATLSARVFPASSIRLSDRDN